MKRSEEGWKMECQPYLTFWTMSSVRQTYSIRSYRIVTSSIIKMRKHVYRTVAAEVTIRQYMKGPFSILCVNGQNIFDC